MLEYHDNEWGVPVHDDTRLLELLVLEGQQAGLSWETILKKRENLRRAYSDFDAAKLSQYGEEDVTRLLSDSGIIRNRSKINAATINAQKVVEIQAAFGSFDAYIWSFVGGKPIMNQFTDLSQLPSETAESKAMSRDLKGRGFRFVGPTICYAFMQATGMVNDHIVDCFRYEPICQMSR